MAVNSLVVIFGVCILFSAIVVIHKARKSLPWWPLTPVMVTLIFVVCGSVFLGFGATLGLIRTVGFATFFIVMQDETGRELRRIPPAIEYVRNSMFSLGYCLTIGVAVVLPLIWVSQRRNLERIAISHTTNLFALATCIGFRSLM
jgi:hypothetical protein